MQPFDIVSLPQQQSVNATLPMPNFTPTQLRFTLSTGFPVRTDCSGGGLLSDLGPILQHGTDRKIDLAAQLTSTTADRWYLVYVQHPMQDLLTYQLPGRIQRYNTEHSHNAFGYPPPRMFREKQRPTN